MNMILSIAIGVVFFLTLSSNANVYTISEENSVACQKTWQGLMTMTSNETDQRKFNPVSEYYIKDTYRTRNLYMRSEIRRIHVDGKVQERGFRVRVDDTKRVRLTKSESLPDVDIRRERVRNTREPRDVTFGINADRRALERNDRRFLENRFDERAFRREVRDGRRERQTGVTFRDSADRRALERNDGRFLENRFDERTSPRREIRDGRHERQTTIGDGTDARRRTAAHVRQNYMVAVKNKEDSTSWPFSNFVQSTIGVLGLYYFGMHNKSLK